MPSQSKKKSTNDVSDALLKIFKTYIPGKLQTDRGNEFTGSKVKSLLDDLDIFYYTSQNQSIKCSVVERWNRTLKGKLYKFFSATRKRRYVDVLQQFVDTYNATVHHSTKVAPKDVGSSNRAQVFANMYGYKSKRDFLQSTQSHPKIKVGDSVRLQHIRFDR